MWTRIRTRIRTRRKRKGMLRLLPYLIILLISNLLTSNAGADIRPEKVFVAEAKKTKFYIKEGLITGGDHAINDVTVKDIRHAANSDFERIVLDLEGNQNHESVAIQRPPYYQLAVHPLQKRVDMTLWGRPKLAFDPQKVIHAFKKSAVVQKMILLPRLEDESWTFAFMLKSESPIEVFELTNPLRVIIDIQRKKH